MPKQEVVSGSGVYNLIAGSTASVARGVIISRDAQVVSFDMNAHAGPRHGLPGEIRREHAASWHLDRHYSLLATLMNSDDDAITASVAGASAGWLDD